MAAAQLLAQQASVSGIAVDQTGSPLPGVHVRLITGNFAGNGGVDAVYGAVSSTDGRFTIGGLKPGLYIVYLEKAGYLQMVTSDVPIPTIALKADQRVADYKVTMAARAVIAGRVVDEFGDPVDKVNVQVEPVTRKVDALPTGVTNSVTDDRGEFRLSTTPGKYYVKATTYGGTGQPAEVRTDGTSSAPFVTTYYPSAANAGGASAVQVGAGQDVTGIDIRLLRAAGAGVPSRSLTVSGTVIGVPADGRATVIFRFGDTAEQMGAMRATGTTSDGKFTMSGLPPGSYQVTAYSTADKTTLQSRPATFHLEGADQTGIQLTLAPGEALAGKLELVGEGAAVGKQTVSLQPGNDYMRFGGSDLPSAVVAPDGSYRLTNIMPGKFKVQVEPLPENGYVKDVALDGKVLTDRVLDFSQGVTGSQLKVTVSRNGGRISGRILTTEGDLATGLVEAFLTNDPKALDNDSVKRVSDGKYSFDTVRPGKYRLFAIDVLQLMSVLTGPDTADSLKPFFDAAEEIEVKDGDRVSKDLTAFTKAPEKK